MVDRASILVLASHSMELVEKSCNKIIRMEHGKIIDIREHTPQIPPHEVSAGHE